jgi:hypothetical protein
LGGRPATTTSTIAARLAHALRNIRHQLLSGDSTIIRVGSAVAHARFASPPFFPPPFASRRRTLSTSLERPPARQRAGAAWDRRRSRRHA